MLRIQNKVLLSSKFTNSGSTWNLQAISANQFCSSLHWTIKEWWWYFG